MADSSRARLLAGSDHGHGATRPADPHRRSRPSLFGHGPVRLLNRLDQAWLSADARRYRRWLGEDDGTSNAQSAMTTGRGDRSLTLSRSVTSSRTRARRISGAFGVCLAPRGQPPAHVGQVIGSGDAACGLGEPGGSGVESRPEPHIAHEAGTCHPGRRSHLLSRGEASAIDHW